MLNRVKYFKFNLNTYKYINYYFNLYNSIVDIDVTYIFCKPLNVRPDLTILMGNGLILISGKSLYSLLLSKHFTLILNCLFIKSY